MPTRQPQAIAGVSSTSENRIEELFPSIALTSLGQNLARLYESIPFGLGPLKLSYLLFVPPTLPVVVAIYFWLKLRGPRYVVTNRAVKQYRGQWRTILAETSLSAIDAVSVDPDSRSAFYHTGDVRLTNAAGETLQILRAVPTPDRFAHLILQTCDARRQVEQSLATIRHRRG